MSPGGLVRLRPSPFDGERATRPFGFEPVGTVRRAGGVATALRGHVRGTGASAEPLRCPCRATGMQPSVYRPNFPGEADGGQRRIASDPGVESFSLRSERRKSDCFQQTPRDLQA